ncbi:hypothetical protein [Peloplasma aerotolerans]|uniref:Uncharacterized protein n=1 Tax=Peloplasma aerotolerans TaxID=3044389 RepID=A0AAW6UC47_9MOLU|nr:hypothetical protein [Mariniplasma sp. M4Ah]MDI6453686.1 hypothetical protein [Mariniplasma sp. M4Ah]
MKKIVAMLSGITISGVIIFCLKAVVRGYIKSNPEEVLAWIFNGIGYLIIQAINIIEWFLQITL